MIYTGGVIRADLAFARLFLSLAFGIGIGIVMALIFRREDVEHAKAEGTDEEIMNVFRAVRDDIEKEISALLKQYS